MATNIQSISENSPLTTPEIGDSETQGTLPVGPTGRVHRGGGTVPWAKRCALTLTPMRLLTTRQFEKDLKRDRKRGKNLDTLWSVVERLLSKQPLDPRHRRHRLTGDWSPCWECHI